MSDDSSLYNRSDLKKRSALLRILRATLTLPAQVTFYGAALGAILLIPHADLPSTLIALATGVGVNALSSVLERVSRGDEPSEDDIRSTVLTAIHESHIDEALSANATQAAIAKLFHQLDLLMFAAKSNEHDIALRLDELARQHQEFSTELHGDLIAVETVLQRLEQLLYPQACWFERQLADQDDRDWDNLREEYLKCVRTQYRLLDFRGLAPQLMEGRSDLLLADVYTELHLEKGFSPFTQFRPRELETSPEEEGESANLESDRSKKPELTQDKSRIEYEPLRQGVPSTMFNATEVTNIWDEIVRGKTVVLGEPGAGKTTTLRYVALVMAGEPNTTELDGRLAGRLPIVARLAKYSNRLVDQPEWSLAEYLCHQYRPEFTPLLERELRAGRCLVLLDGLDEASSVTRIVEEIEEFLAGYGDNWILVTCRESVFRHTPFSGNFQCITIKPMDTEYINHFIDQWHNARAASRGLKLSGEEESGSRDLIDALRERPKLAELAKNPLMLTIILLMHWNATVLPESAIEVYQAATDTLIKYWPKHQQRIGLETLHLQTVRQILKPIAYRMLRGNGLIDENDLLQQLTEEIARVNHWDESRAHEEGLKLLDVINLQSGVLVDQGFDNQGRRIFEFWHRRIAEYLAACFLTDLWDGDDAHAVLRHVHDPKWTEVVILFVAQAGSSGRVIQATRALQAILSLNSPWEKIVWRDYLLAGECLGEGVLLRFG